MKLLLIAGIALWCTHVADALEVQQVEVTLGQSVELKCDFSAAKSAHPVKYYYWKGPKLYRPMVRDLVLPAVQSTQLGEYKCFGRGLSGGYEKLAAVNLKQVTETPPETLEVSVGLAPDKTVAASQHPAPKSQPRFEAQIDAGDDLQKQSYPRGRDRDPFAPCEPHSVRCGVHRSRSPKNKCILKHWVCDGQDDCGNGWDEEASQCSTALRLQPSFCACKPSEICCPSQPTVCVPRAFVCDTYRDCPLEREDEGADCCSIDILNDGARSRYRKVIFLDALSGMPFELSCSAASLEQPSINWRFNGLAIPKTFKTDEQQSGYFDEFTGKYHVTSRLLVPRIDRYYSGIFNCEVINKCSRKFSVDYALNVSDFTKKV